ncbi:hypothetical protein K501DRAFT_335154 [Backusella circina FSU 941]|nr:hypothetical protein K501DRAFT_335154 [Backusella circina FSU 941]
MIPDALSYGLAILSQVNCIEYINSIRTNKFTKQLALSDGLICTDVPIAQCQFGCNLRKCGNEGPTSGMGFSIATSIKQQLIITLPIQVFPRQSGPKLEVGSPAIAPLWLLLFRLSTTWHDLKIKVAEVA